MGYTNFGPMGYGPGWNYPLFGSAIILVLLWSLLWKGLALWRAANRGEKWWFIAFLIINTLGILEIIYLFDLARETLGFHEQDHTQQP